MPTPIRDDRECIEYDIVVIGAGPSGLSCAIRLKQLKPDLSICILEKGSEVGAHTLSGAVFEPSALNELIPNWKDKNAPIKTKVTKDKFLFLTKTKSYLLPTPPQMNNHSNYIISLGNLCRWLANQAEEMGIEIFAGFAASEILYNNDNAVIGVATGDMGLNKNGDKTDNFTPGVELHARQTIFAEGCHGSLTKKLISEYNLRKNSNPQTYGLGIKEIWQIKPENHQLGLCQHTIGWPMDTKTYGGSWLYHMENYQISIGFVIGLDYKNPYLSPYEEMQRFKLHPSIKPILDGGKRISYGARSLVEGGFQSLPKLTFPGGLLIGDTAGFLNVPKIKGNHTAIKSGIIAAESLANSTINYGHECTEYSKNLKKSWLWKELKSVRNIRPAFHYGLWIGLLIAGIETITRGLLPWTLKNHSDHSQTGKAANYKIISYPKPDGILTFDRLTSIQLSNTNHEEDQPCHLKLKDPSVPIKINLPEFAEPAQRYCPAGVYEIVKDESGNEKLQINAQNCIHCKTCDIKDPSQNIDWEVPQGGGGPNYSSM